jgi:hypothetical protein
MDYTRAFKILDNMVDKTSTAWFNDLEKELMLTQGTYHYLETIVDNLESDITLTDGLYPITIGPTQLQVTGSTAELPADFAFRLSLYLDFPENIIRYVKLNNWNHSHDDPHNVAGGAVPVTTLGEGGFHLSNYTAGNVMLWYMKHPTFDFVDSNKQWIDLPEQEQFKIIDYSFKLATGALSDGRFQYGVNFINDKRE